MRISDWSSDVCSSDLAAIAVVVTLFGNAVAIGIEHLSHVSQAIPLRGVLREHQHRIIGYNVAEAVAHAGQPIVVVMAFAPLVVEELGGLAMLEQRVAAGIVQRQAQAKRDAMLDWHSVVEGKRVSVRVVNGGRRPIKKK